jgi:hypothetical protein
MKRTEALALSAVALTAGIFAGMGVLAAQGGEWGAAGFAAILAAIPAFCWRSLWRQAAAFRPDHG